MKTILFIDEYKLYNKKLYDEILYVGDNNLAIDKKIKKINLVRYFIKAHKRARIINKILLSIKGMDSPVAISLLKLSDQLIFECARIIELVIELNTGNNHIIIKLHNAKLIKELMKLSSIGFENIIFEETIIKRPIKFNWLKYLLGSIALLIHSLKIRNQLNIFNIFIMYNDKISFDFTKPYLDEKTIIYASNHNKISLYPTNYEVDKYIPYKFITLKSFLYGIKAYRKNKKLIDKLPISKTIKKILISKLYTLEFHNMIYLSLKDKFPNLQNLIGLFDSNATIDYITYCLNKLYNISTICTPHGINFKYKVNYISYGTNIYCFWSINHLNKMKDVNLIDNLKTKKVITGNIVYTNTLKYLLNKQVNSKKILVVGEYFANDNFYSSPFNYEDSKRFFDVLKKFVDLHQECRVTIRTRLDDEYSKLAKKYLSQNIKLSSPKESLIDEINNHDLVISVFSNALHEALLLNKKVLQVNFLGIENYRDLAKDGLVYYAEDENKLEILLEKWSKNELNKLDYDRHLKEYANNGAFNLFYY